MASQTADSMTVAPPRRRSPSEWMACRLARIPRKLGFARHRARWLWLDARNAIRIGWDLRICRRPIADITRYERRIGSQNGEDGILEAIFLKLGTTGKFFVEFGSGNLSECNTVYLARWKGWRGLWMDGGYVDRLGRVRRERITAENVESLFAKYEVPKQFDLLSIDIDGNDYWVWQAIRAYEPRVVIIEYNATFGASERKTIPYDAGYSWTGETNYFGASLPALQRLGEAKGYALVGCDSSGTNAVFVRRDLLDGHFDLGDPSALYRPPTCFDGRGHPRDPRPLVDV